MSKTTKLYRVLNPIAHGGRVERGTEIELTDEQAANYGENYVELVTAKASAEEVEAKPVEKMTVAELRIKAEELGLDATGSKADLVERITLAQDAE